MTQPQQPLFLDVCAGDRVELTRGRYTGKPATVVRVEEVWGGESVVLDLDGRGLYRLAPGQPWFRRVGK